VARNTTRRRGFEKAKRGRQTATAEQSERNADAVGNSTRGVAVGRFQNETRNVRGGEGIEGFGKRYVPAFPKSRRLFAHTILTLFWQNSKEKLTQDVLIDNLQQTLKQLQSRDSVFQAQAGAQKKETELARQTLSAANDEMAVVQLEKQQLVSQWKSALVGNAKRDEALKVTREALTKQRQDMLLLDAEINGKSASMKEQSRKKPTRRRSSWRRFCSGRKSSRRLMSVWLSRKLKRTRRLRGRKPRKPPWRTVCV
jgi:hypothetical protein